jgi:hypothetical protein
MDSRFRGNDGMGSWREIIGAPPKQKPAMGGLFVA